MKTLAFLCSGAILGALSFQLPMPWALISSFISVAYLIIAPFLL